MKETEQVKDLSMQIEEDIRLFNRGVIAQRIGWGIMFLLIVLGAIGMFGTGPVSIKKAQMQNATLEYEHFLRFGSQTELKITVEHQQGQVKLRLPINYLERFTIDHMIPEPETSALVNGQMEYTFPAINHGIIRLFIEPDKTGTVDGRISVNNESASFSHFVYP